MKTILISSIAILGMMLAFPSFACDGHKDGATAQKDKTSCGSCGTDKCSCEKAKDGESCGACGTDKCTCGGKDEAKTDAKKAS